MFWKNLAVILQLVSVKRLLCIPSRKVDVCESLSVLETLVGC